MTKKISDKQRQNFLKTPIDPDTIERLNMEDLVLEFFDNKEKQERALKILDTKKLTESLIEYVEKNATSTIDETTDFLIKRGQKALLEKTESQNMSVTGAMVREFFDDELAKQKKTQDEDERPESRKRLIENSDEASSNEADGDEVQEVPQRKMRQTGETTSKSKQRSRQLQRSRTIETTDWSGDDKDGEPSAKPKIAAARSKRVASIPRKRYKLESDDEYGSDDDFSLQDNENVGQTKKRGRATASERGNPTTSTSKSRKRSTAVSNRQSRLLNDSDSDSSDHALGTGSFENEHWGSTATKSQL